MGASNSVDEFFEYRVEYCHIGSEFTSDRHFTARDVNHALSMFEFARRKDDMKVDIKKVERWNRWADRWEEESIVALEEISEVKL